MVNYQRGAQTPPTVENGQNLPQLAVEQDVPTERAHTLRQRLEFAYVLPFGEVSHEIESDTANASGVERLQLAVAFRAVEQRYAFISPPRASNRVE
jgi:hypothetical protein